MSIPPRIRAGLMIGGALEILGGLLAVVSASYRHDIVPAVVAPMLLLSGVVLIVMAMRRA